MKVVVLWVFVIVLIGILLFGAFNISGLVYGEGEVVCYDNNNCSFEIRPCLKIVCINPGTVKSYCDRVPIRECYSGDGCCPDICGFNNDTDCESESPFISQPICGNSILEEEEACDGSDSLLDVSCENFGYDYGEMGCDDDCMDFNFDNCFYLDSDEEEIFIGESEAGQVLIVGQGQNCYDGTDSGYCSSVKPYYCVNNILIKNCGVCGCNSGEECVVDQCLTAPEIGETSNKCKELSQKDCEKNNDCLPINKPFFGKVYQIYDGCVMKECKHFSKKECKERAGCKLVYDEFCIGYYWCFFKYYKACEQV